MRDHPADAAAMGRRARERVLDKFIWPVWLIAAWRSMTQHSDIAVYENVKFT